MKIILTGASGFVGQNLNHYLKDSFEIKALQRNELYFVEANMLNGYTTLVHLAGKAHDVKKLSNPNEYYETNFQLTKTLYDEFLKSDSEKFIFISSVKAAADEVGDLLTEDQLASPRTHYGKSKLMAEQYIQNQPLPEGKSYYILRPCMIHGPGNKGNLNLLYKFVKKGIPYPLAGFDNKRSFLSIGNLCFVINELIIKNDIPSGVYQVSDDDALSTNEIVSILASSLNMKSKLWKISPNIIKFFAKIGDFLHLPLTTERLGKLTESYVVSNKKIKNALNKELPLTTIEGLKITANSFNGI
jgi:nucleoside-diphosphate-sugar epimerase